MKTFKSDLSKTDFPIKDRVSGKLLRQSILSYIQKEYPSFTVENYLSLSELNNLREKYITDYLTGEVDVLNELNKTVVESLTDKTLLTEKIEEEDVVVLSVGQRVADKVATFGGSWKFIILFSVFIVIWIGINIFVLSNKPFDAYPFILLNLILSCIAAMQAPVIMMSQNRQEEKDRERAKKDYMINLKSELEIRILHEKIDHLIMHDQQELLEIQKVQIEMMNDIIKQIAKK